MPDEPHVVAHTYDTTAYLNHRRIGEATVHVYTDHTMSIFIELAPDQTHRPETGELQLAYRNHLPRRN